MFINFFKIALRYLWRNKTYSILNALCLTFGLTCAIIALLHILTLFNYDKFHKNYERLYTVEAYVTHFNGNRFPKDLLSASLSNTLKEQMPEIEEITRIVDRDYTFVHGNKFFTEQGIYVDNNFFSAFTFPLVQGDTRNLFDEVNSIVISEQMAKKFFESTDCLGKILILKDNKKQEAFKVTGVVRDVPSQSFLKFDYVMSFSKFLSDNPWASETGASAVRIWALLKNNVNANVVNHKIQNLIKNQEATLNQELFLFPLKEKILYRYADGKRTWNEMQNVVMEGIIGFAILLIACFNFINLAIALNIRRHREVGIKKVTGSKKLTIAIQFLGETFIITLVSLMLAVMLSKLLLTTFNAMFGENIILRFSDFNILLIFLAITLFTSLVSGLLPAFYLALSNPISVLKGKIITGHSYSIFRQSLIVFQLTIPVILIICMLVIKVQDKYMQNFNIGVDRDKLIVLDNSENIQKHAEKVKADLRSIPGIDAVSFTNCIPTRGAKVSSEVSWEGKDASEKLHFWCINTDFDYNKTVEVKMIAGRFFNSILTSDSANYVINDLAAKVLKYKNPIGYSLMLDGKKGTIIGVFKDFHVVDLRGPVVPTIIRIKPKDCHTLLVKFSSGSYRTLTDKIGKVYKHYEPDNPYQLRVFRNLPEFLNLHALSNLIGLASVIAIMLACLGLFGLASFTAVSRTKEIGIRKTNGATTLSVMCLLLASYTKWLTIACFIALPIAFLLGNVFLGMFHFHTSFSLLVFLAGPVIVYVVALVTVSGQAYCIASQNSVKVLRYE